MTFGKSILLSAAIALSGALVPALRAEIETPVLEVTSTLENGTTTVAAEISLKNSGTRAVAVQRIEADCTCVKVEAKASSIAPGKTLVIRAVAEIKNPLDKQKKNIIVFTDDLRDSIVHIKWTIVRAAAKP